MGTTVCGGTIVCVCVGGGGGGGNIVCGDHHVFMTQPYNRPSLALSPLKMLQ